MQEKLDEIDTRALDELARIHDERQGVRGLRERAEAKKDQVDEAVFRRVIRDYEQREDALDQEAAPLLEDGRAEYRKLASALESADEKLAAARSRRQELEFRHEVGELDEEELEEHLEDPTAAVDRCEKTLEELGEICDQLVEAFGSEETLQEQLGEERDSHDPAADEEDTREEKGAAETETAEEEDTAEKEEDAPEEQTESDEPPEPSADATRVALEEVADPEEPGAAGAAPDATVVADVPTGGEAEETDDSDAAAATMALPVARLLLHGDGEEEEEFSLGPLTYVGRAPDNQVRVESPAVSRKHALISAGPEGFVIEDLGSPNGTFVNDEKTDGEQELHDGDTVKLGDVELTFRSP